MNMCACHELILLIARTFELGIKLTEVVSLSIDTAVQKALTERAAQKETKEVQTRSYEICDPRLQSKSHVSKLRYYLLTYQDSGCKDV